MSTRSDKAGKPILEDHDDPSIKFYDGKVIPNCSGPTAYQRKSGRDRSVNLDEAMEMTDILLMQYECNYRVHDIDKTLIHFPYLFQRPPDGAKIRNKNTGEVYVIKETLIDPRSKNWEGLVKIEYTATFPNRLRLEKIEFLDEKNHVRFTSEDPQSLGLETQDEAGLIKDSGPIRPTVVHALIRKLPGTISSRPFAPAKQYRPILRETLRSTDDPNHTIEMYGQLFDHLVQFDCWTTDNFSADKLADWFERFVSLYGKILKLNGVQEVLFWERLRDASVTKWRQDLKSRAVQYFIRTEYLEAVFTRDITDIDINANLADSIEPCVGEYEVAGQIVSGQITSAQYSSMFRDSDGKYLFGNFNITDQNLT